jgi:integrase
MPQVSGVEMEQLRLFDSGVDMQRLREVRSELATYQRSAATRHAYAADVKIYSDWCKAAGRTPIPAGPETISLFLSAQIDAGKKISTLDRRLAAITAAHSALRHPVPDLFDARELLINARRKKREKPTGKRALSIEDLVKISRRLGKSPKAIRDRAVLVFGLASGLRRGELCRLNVSDIQISRKGIVIDIQHSKTDPTGKGRIFGIFAGKRASTDPVRTIRAWLKIRGKEDGPLFSPVYGNVVANSRRIDGRTINHIVKLAVERAGLDPRQYGAHSLRAGLVTAAAENGASDQEIMRASGHKTAAVMQRYVRHTRAFAMRNVLAGAL